MKFLMMILSLLSALSSSVYAEAVLAPVDLALNWKPEPEFGGFYEAKAKKYYEQAGLAVDIVPGGAGQPVTQMVAAKRVTFGIASAEEIVLARAQGAKIVALFAVYQNDPQGFMVHPERKIKTLKDLFQSEGIIALQKGLPFTEWLVTKYAPVKATMVPYTGGITQFLKDKRFAQQCFVTSEPIAARREKVPTQTLLVSDSGFNPYLTVVITHEDTIRKEAGVVKKFIKATREGWSDYLKSSKETNILMQKLNPGMTLADFNESAKIQKPFIETRETKSHGLGSMTAERWSMLQSQLIEINLLKSASDVNSIFKNSVE